MYTFNMRDNNARKTIAGGSIDRRRSIRNRVQRRRLLSLSLSLSHFHSRGVPHVRVRAVTAGITMHDVTLGSNPPYLLRATMLQESETLANQVTPTSYSRRSAAMPIDEIPFNSGLDAFTPVARGIARQGDKFYMYEL